MGISRISPQSIIGRQKAMTKAKTKKDGAIVPADNILSDVTSERLDNDLAAFDAGIAAISSAENAYHTAVLLARPQRIILRKNILSFFKTLNNCIDNLDTIPNTARGFYGLPITKGDMPDINTDDKLLTMGAKVLSGDLLRIADGGIAMSAPTIAEFTIVFNIAKPIILAISNAKTAEATATRNLQLQAPEVKDLITHIWDEVEQYYSLITPSNRRTQARLWGVRYISTGVPSVITGKCATALGVGIAGVKIRIVGSSHFVLTDAEGNFSLNTSLYGDLELLATLKNYVKNTIDFSKDDGVAEVVNVVMVHV